MGLFRRLARGRILKQGLIADETWKLLLEQHPILAGLSAEEEARLRELSTIFLHEKVFTAAEGLKLTDHYRAVIAVQACLPILALDLDWYDNWKTVVVVPDVFYDERAEADAAGVVHEWTEDKSGLSWDEGPVVLSWEDVEASGWGDGYNVIIHEATHRLDLTDGAINGCPALHEGMDPKEWRSVFLRSFEDLKLRSKGSGKRRRGRRKPKIDTYATESDGEFFAVSAEYFFEQPRVLAREYADVYRLLREFFRQDPAARRHGAAKG